MPPFLKQCIGLSQILVMVELSIRIQQSIENVRYKQERLEKLIIVSRVIVCLLIAFIIIGWSVTCLVYYSRYKDDDDYLNSKLALVDLMGPINGDNFLVLTILLFASISLVIWKLKVKARLSRVTTGFKKEIRNLLIILFLFSFSFLTRWVFDAFLVKDIIHGQHNDEKCHDVDDCLIFCYPYTLSMILLTTQYVFDILPIGLILLFHYYNFKNLEEEQAESSHL